MSIVVYEKVESKIISVRRQHVIIDSDVAELYGVTTKHVNQAVSRNQDKFPDGYTIALTKAEKEEVVTHCDHLQNLKYSPTLPRRGDARFYESGSQDGLQEAEYYFYEKDAICMHSST